jgi:hypothetical protein
MALPDTVSLDGDAEALPATTEGSISYDLISMDSGGSVRAVAALANSNPQTLKVSTSSSSKNGISRKRHLVRIDASADDEDEGLVGYSAYLVIDRPVGTAVTTDNITAAVGRICKLVNTTGYLTKVLNGEP